LGQYFYILILSFVFFVGLSAYLLHLIRLKKKNGDSYKIPVKEALISVFFIVLSGPLFIYSLLDLPNVLANKTERIEGNCDIWIFESTKGGHTSVDLGERSITFPENYQGIEEGSYYCEVEYYPRTETGKSLKVYELKGGKSLN
jgi:hypothetical protein